MASFRIAVGSLVALLLASVASAQDQLAPFEGTYPLTRTVAAKIKQDAGQWAFTLGDQKPQPIESNGAGNWRVPALEIDLSIADHAGKPSLWISRYGVKTALSDVTPKDAETSAVLDRLTPRCMIALNVPGVSIAVVKDRKVAWLGQYGIKTVGKSDKVDVDTIFEAASMSKPAFAYVAMQLVQEGTLDLDVPLVKVLGKQYIENEPLHEKITGRMALSHTTGFPNWREGGWKSKSPLRVMFEPGSKVGYSGEGTLMLQRAVEKISGKGLEPLMQERLLKPLGMTRSSYVWQSSYDAAAAAGHDAQGNIPERRRSIYRDPNAAFTLYTTPSDYAQFLIEMMREDRSAKYALNTQTLSAMLTPQSYSPTRDPVERRNGKVGTVHYGLGWRLDTLPAGNRYYHSGSNGTGFRCFSEFNPKTGNGIVIMTNSASGGQLWMELMRSVGEE